MSDAEKMRYFLAIVPKEEVQEKTEQIKQTIATQYNLKAALRSPSHITLHMPFEWKTAKEDLLIATLSAFRFREEFSITLNGFGCFEPRVVFIHVENSIALRTMQDELVYFVKSKLGLFNQADDRRGFHPHITMAFRDLKKQDFYPLWEAYKDRAFHAEFVTNSFCLLRHDGLRWQVLQDFRFVAIP